jgi:hypothetical protein
MVTYVPLSVFGVGRIGGDIISGPWVENGLASFIISFGVPADPSGSRDIREIAFDSEVVWTTNGATGVTTLAGGTFTVEAFTARFYQGTLTQGADTLESTHFGAAAVAYRPQILLAFSNLPIAATKFKKIPYVAAVIGDGSGNDVNLGEAFERLAYSPWVGYTSAQFETSGITDGLVDGGLIIAQDAEFLSLIQQFGRFYPTWNILQTDKLRIVDRGATVTADIILDTTRLVGPLTTTRQGPDTVRKDLELSTIDPDADYTIVPSVAYLPRDPVAVTTSVGRDSVYLPAIMDAHTRASVVTFAKYHEEQARKSISGIAMAYGLEIEPGDLVRISDIGDDFSNETFSVMETLHGQNYLVEFTAAAILNCDATDADINFVVLLMGFEGADGSQTAPGFTDESAARHGTATIANSPQIDTAQSKFGSSSLLSTGGAPGVTFNGSADWLLSSSNSDQFTIECFVRFSAFTAGYSCLVSWSAIGVVWDFSVLDSHELRFRYVDTSVVTHEVASTGAAITTGIWYHFAVDKDSSGKIRIYKDGVMLASATPADSSMSNQPTFALHIGSAGIFNADKLDGWMDELRITKGVARYASDAGFTPPTAAFLRI